MNHENAPPPEPKRRFWSVGRKILVGIIVIPILLFAFYMFSVINWTYSDGERAGILQKFSHKGWICKTWEGELAVTTVPGVAPEIFFFTVREENTSHKVESLLGKRVVLHYREHRGVPTTCFGMTDYWVDSLRVVE